MHCPKAGRKKLWIFPVTGFLALAWWLARVIPKPSRAAYPCQRAAAPLASGFVIWLMGALSSALLYRRGKQLWHRSRALACVCLALAIALGVGTLATSRAPEASAAETPNQPVGAAKGIYPGRVVWAHDADATNWDGPGQGHWWEASHTSQAVVDRMMSSAIQRLAGKNSDADAMDAIFRSFNRTHGRGDNPYKPGEKIMIKINLVGCIVGGSAVDPKTYDLVNGIDYMNSAPQMVVALLRQLTKAGARQEDISVGDPLSLYPNQFVEICRREFPDVRYLDHDGGNAEHFRAPIRLSSVPFYWSARPEGKTQDYVPEPYAQATYLVNMANFKAHNSAGVTLCAKNHYGSLFRKPPEKGYYDMHASMASEIRTNGHYRAMVDLMGHAHLGGKTVLFLVDGLYPGIHPKGRVPVKWSTFDGDWASSLFASQDPVAIDSVALDFLQAEWSDVPHMPGTEDYLHEAALANDPPSHTFYDPDHATNTKRLPSLGVHEHWNNPQARQYSRNLGKREGIELVRVEGKG